MVDSAMTVKATLMKHIQDMDTQGSGFLERSRLESLLESLDIGGAIHGALIEPFVDSSGLLVEYAKFIGDLFPDDSDAERAAEGCQSKEDLLQELERTKAQLAADAETHADVLQDLERTKAELDKVRDELKLAKGDGSLPKPAGDKEVRVDFDPKFEHGRPLSFLLRLFSTRIGVVSTPQRGPRCGSMEAPFDQEVMNVHDELIRLLFPTYVPGYDFAGSSSKRDCENCEPDKSMTHADWSDPERIRESQWFRYWMGRARATISSLIFAAPPLQNTITIESHMTARTLAKNSRVAFLFSVAGGVVTQTEFEALPGIINGAVSDIVMRESRSEPMLLWIHFQHIEHLLKALQGFGGIDFSSVVDRMILGLPGEWHDGPYNPDCDMLKSLPGETPESRRQHCLRACDSSSPDDKLLMLSTLKSPEIVSYLLEQRANPNAVDTKYEWRPSALEHASANCANVASTKLLVEARADLTLKNRNGILPLRALNILSAAWPTHIPEVQDKLNQLRALLSPPTVGRF